MSNIEEYTKNFKFMIPEFNIATWHTEIKENFKAIDALIANFVQAQQYKGAWKQVTQYYVGDLVYISDEDSNNYGGLFKVLVNHITTGDDFDTFLGNNPTYYDLQGEMGAQVAALRAQDWASKTNGKVVVNESPVDYSAKAYAIGGTGTTTNNAKYFKQQAELARDGILLDPGFIAVKTDMLGDQNIKTVATNIQKINNVSNNLSNILLVNNNLSSINVCSSNINAIRDAPNQATNAQNSATSAAQSAALAYQYGNDKINQTHITNCITNIPQDIKLELNSGVLTLKAGSKVYVPNGSGVFNVVTTSNDLTFTQSSAEGKNFLYVNSAGTGLSRHNNVASGASVPANFTGTFYDTTINTIQYYSSGTPSTTLYSFPIAIITIETQNTATVSSIDQVFNGIGYIGSTIFALPGVKGLIPNGRNADGTLKSTSFTYTSVKTETRSDYGNNVRAIKLNGSSISAAAITNVQYDSASNFNIEGGTPRSVIYGGILTTIDSAIQSIVSLDSTPVFHAVDYADVALKNEPNNFYGQNSFEGLVFHYNTVFLKGGITLGQSNAVWGKQIQFQDTNGTRIGRIQPKAKDITNNSNGIYTNNATNTSEYGLEIHSDGYATAPTPSSAADHSTKIVTTDWGQTAFSNAIGTPRDVTVLWGDGTGVSTPSEFQLSENFTNFEQIVVFGADDYGNGRNIITHSTYWLDYMMTHSANNNIFLWYNDGAYLKINSYTSTTNPSTKTKLKVNTENSITYNIFGINRKVKNVPDPML